MGTPGSAKLSNPFGTMASTPMNENDDPGTSNSRKGKKSYQFWRNIKIWIISDQFQYLWHFVLLFEQTREADSSLEQSSLTAISQTLSEISCPEQVYVNVKTGDTIVDVSFCISSISAEQRVSRASKVLIVTGSRANQLQAYLHWRTAVACKRRQLLGPSYFHCRRTPTMCCSISPACLWHPFWSPRQRTRLKEHRYLCIWLQPCIPHSGDFRSPLNARGRKHSVAASNTTLSINWYTIAPPIACCKQPRPAIAQTKHIQTYSKRVSVFLCCCFGFEKQTAFMS